MAWAGVIMIECAAAQFERQPRLIHTDETGRFGLPGTEEWMAFLWDSEANLLGLVERRPPAS